MKTSLMTLGLKSDAIINKGFFGLRSGKPTYVALFVLNRMNRDFSFTFHTKGWCQMIDVYQLAKLVVGRASLQNGCFTAIACGDSEWSHRNLDSLEWHDQEITKLKDQATKSELIEAREITNATI